MKNSQHRIIFLLAFCLFGFTQIIWAQSDYMISEPKSNDMKLSGTSFSGDWDMRAYVFSGKTQFNFKKGGQQLLVGSYFSWEMF